MLRVGLTGGIAAGKTTVGKMFVELGCHLIDSDNITHKLFEPGEAVHASVAEAFGGRVLSDDGGINRKVLGEIVFNDPAARSKLNALVHPAVIQRQQEWLRQVEREDPAGIGIVDATLMIETGSYKNYDRVVVVTCAPDIQKRRLRERSRLSEEQIEARIRSQMPMEEKVKHADYVVDNSGDLAETRRQVEAIHSKLRELAAHQLGI
jgi:dephospho-CoA kinase